ncbi:OLC1v1033417C1 [Oldenlandia corymbosa var. corymbosa]|uniref:OLC1v1033417C1 n=1 Tax=Oldenlandia corymbosa var. corymbosa TaxID=529605 RepID=A0AAV1CP02_OLDCO|nr:OLC1v1033417C1 [Oldenlandia corymbosa var. corymbosa]
MSSKSDMKGYYKQRKNSGGVTKSNPKSSVSSTKKSSLTPKNTATYGSDITQPPALIAHGSPDLKDDHDSKEEVLRQFDMNMMYGPCIGMTRLARWERAKSLGLNPPEDVEDLLKSGKAEAECLWDGRV